MRCDDNLKRSEKIVHVSDAYFCCHEFEETGYLNMASSLREHLGFGSILSNIKNGIGRKMTKAIESGLLVAFVYSLEGAL